MEVGHQINTSLLLHSVIGQQWQRLALQQTMIAFEKQTTMTRPTYLLSPSNKKNKSTNNHMKQQHETTTTSASSSTSKSSMDDTAKEAMLQRLL